MLTLSKAHEAESAVLGCIILSPDKFDEVAAVIGVEDFSSEAHAAVFQAILMLVNAGSPIDILLIKKHLMDFGKFEGIGGNSGIAALLEQVPTGTNAVYYAEIVKGFAIRQRLLEVAEFAKTAAEDDQLTPEMAVGRTLEAAEGILSSSGIQSTPRPIKGLLSALMGVLQDQVENGKSEMGLTSGYPDLDNMLTGMHSQELIIIAGRPSMGKSTLAINMIRRCAMQGNPSLLYSLEMSADNITLNLLSAQSRVSGQNLRRADLTTDNLGELMGACNDLYEAPIYVVDKGGITLGELCRTARTAKRKYGLSSIFIDYLQLVTVAEVRGKSREQQVSEVSRGLKALAKQLDIPVIALAQLNRQPGNRTDSRPQLSDLRESGAIEQDADVVMMVHRPDYYNPQDNPGVTEILVKKQRNGPTGIVNLTFIGSQFRFEPCAKYQSGGNTDEF